MNEYIGFVKKKSIVIDIVYTDLIISALEMLRLNSKRGDITQAANT